MLCHVSLEILDWWSLRFGRRYSSAGIRGEAERVPHGTNSKNESDHERAAVGTFAAGKAALLIGTSIGSGIHVGMHSCAEPTRPQNHDTAPDAVPGSPTFGSLVQFQIAISTAFSDEGVVSTDPEDLRVHGFSENDYYPGASHLRFSI